MPVSELVFAKFAGGRRMHCLRSLKHIFELQGELLRCETKSPEAHLVVGEHQACARVARACLEHARICCVKLHGDVMVSG